MKNPKNPNQTNHNILDYIDPLKTFDKFKYNQKIYFIGDIILIKSVYSSTQSTYNSLGKLIRIIPINGIPEDPNWPSIEVQWYYQKCELIRTDINGLTNENYFNSLSEDEVFESDHRDIIFIETVVDKAKIVSLQEYIQLNGQDDNVFFYRARYDPFNYEITPDIRKWKKYCSCNMPLNPNMMYIKCDGCNKWYHVKCVGIKEEEIKNKKNFICGKCTLSN